MPVQFLSEAEHKSLNRFPSEISSEDLNRFFLLSDQELSILKQLRAEHNRLGFALQGYGKGVTFYSWTSDQFSQYGSKPIPATVRDATYVLDEILNNETELSILEHTTDTAGYTEVIFALFDLLGMRSHLFYANQGEIKTQQDDQLLNQVGCLNLVTNAIIVWNTVYIDKVVQQLRQEGRFIDDEDLKFIWPTRHTHINVYGQYHFDEKRLRKKHPLRTLRNPGS